MTEDLRKEIREMHEQGFGTNEIARILGIHTHSVRWVLRRAEHLAKEREKRKKAGAMDYKCGKCGQPGHNRLSCGVVR